MLKGIDVYHNTGTVDWTALASSGDVAFAIAKATEGVTFNDPAFLTNWPAISAAGLLRGAYHLARPSNNDPIPEADHFLTRIGAGGGLQPGDIIALDIEDTNVASDANLHDWTLSWLQYVEGQVGFKPFFYSGTWYMDPHGLTGSTDLGGYPLWFSSYNETFGQIPNPPNGWSAVVIHQYSEHGSETGISTDVDLDCFTGDTVAQLAQYGKPASVSPPEVTGVNPNEGLEGIQVVISGTGFTGATDVGFGGTNVSSMTVDPNNPDTQITVTAPSGNGTVDVIVIGPGGSSSPNATAKFSYD